MLKDIKKILYLLTCENIKNLDKISHGKIVKIKNSDKNDHDNILKFFLDNDSKEDCYLVSFLERFCHFRKGLYMIVRRK